MKIKIFYEGFLLATATTHKEVGEISKTLKSLCPSFLNENTRLYYNIYFFDKNSSFKDFFVDFKKDNNIIYPFVLNYFITALDKDMTTIKCAKTNKLLFVKDNIKHSKINLNELGDQKNKLTNYSELYCNKNGTLIQKNTVLPIKFNDIKVNSMSNNNTTVIEDHTSLD